MKAAAPQKVALREVILWPAVFLLAFVKIRLVEAQALTAMGIAVYDDRLFLTLAESLLKGNWLGPYDAATLVKGPFYPLWIAAVFKVGVPLLLAQHLLYILACVVLVIALRPLIASPLTAFLVYVVVLFNPMSYISGVTTQVLREGIYPALTVLTFACAIGVLLRRDGSIVRLLVWTVSLGFALSALWLTREEGVWIVPSMIFFLVSAGISLFLKKKAVWLRSVFLFIPLLVFFLVIGVVARFNMDRYGIYTVTEVKSPEFLSAYGALLRVKHKAWKPYVPVPADVRERLYAVSPAFAELKPYFEGESGKKWTVMFSGIRELCKKDHEIARKVDMLLNMDASGIWKKVFYDDNGDIPGGWFMWAFREAAASAGHYTSGKSSQDYYRRLAAEVNAACAAGRLECGPERASLMPPWRHESDYPFLKSFAYGALLLSTFEGFNVDPDYSWGDPGALKFFRDLTHERLSPDEFNVRGWAFSQSGNINISIRTSSGELVGQPVKLLSSPDVYKHFLSVGSDFPAAREARFDVRGPIKGEFLSCQFSCFMHIEKDGKLVKRVPLDGTVMSLKTGDLQLYFDFLGLKDAISKSDRLKLKILGLIGKAYRWAVPLLLVPAFAVYIFNTFPVVRGNRPGADWIISTSLLIAVFCRLVILSMIHVTSFPAIIPLYLTPAYPLMLIFILLVLIKYPSGPQFWRKKTG